MDNYDKTIKSIIRFSDPYESVIDFQNRLTDSMNLITQNFSQPFLETETRINSLLAPMNRIQDMINTYTKVMIPEPFITTNVMNRYERLIQEGADSIASAFHSISICSDYVSMPDLLVPDDIDCIDKDGHVKKLTFPNALKAIYDLVILLVAILGLLQPQLPSAQEQENHEEIVSLEKEQNDLLRQQIQQDQEYYEEAASSQEEHNDALKQQICDIEEDLAYLIDLFDSLQNAEQVL